MFTFSFMHNKTEKHFALPDLAFLLALDKIICQMTKCKYEAFISILALHVHIDFLLLV